MASNFKFWFMKHVFCFDLKPRLLVTPIQSEKVLQIEIALPNWSKSTGPIDSTSPFLRFVKNGFKYLEYRFYLNIKQFKKYKNLAHEFVIFTVIISFYFIVQATIIRMHPQIFLIKKSWLKTRVAASF